MARVYFLYPVSIGRIVSSLVILFQAFVSAFIVGAVYMVCTVAGGFVRILFQIASVASFLVIGILKPVYRDSYNTHGLSLSGQRRC